MMIGIRRVIGGDPDERLSELRPSDIRFNNFHLTSLQISSIRRSTHGNPAEISHHEELNPDSIDSREPETPCGIQDAGTPKNPSLADIP